MVFRMITLEIVFLLLSRLPPHALISTTVAPICRPGQVQTYNVGRGETAQIHCEVEGIPRDINFVWKFNTSVSEVLDMPSSIVSNNSTRSTLHFKPMTEHVIFEAESLDSARLDAFLFSFPRFHYHYRECPELESCERQVESVFRSLPGEMNKSSFGISHLRTHLSFPKKKFITKEAAEVECGGGKFCLCIVPTFAGLLSPLSLCVCFECESDRDAQLSVAKWPQERE
jgi:hypothetical protein